MSALSPRAAARTARASAIAAGLAVCLAAGAAAANPTGGLPDWTDSGKDRVILQAPSSEATAATLSLSKNAPRLVNGAAVRVQATYKCPQGTQGFLHVQLVEVTGSTVAQGSGTNSQPLTCDGTARKADISVVVTNDYPFKAGKAFGQGFLHAFSETVEATAVTEQTITIK